MIAPFGAGPFPAVGGGGTSTVEETSEWTLLTSVEQADGLPSDPGSMTTTGSVFSAGRATVVCAAHTSIVVGYQNAMPRWSQLISTLYPDFDYRTDTLELGVDLVTFAHGNVEVGVWFGVVDSTTVDASLAGGAVGIRTAGAAQDQLSFITATASTPISNLGLLVDEVHGTFVFGFDGTNYPVVMGSRYNPEGTTRLGAGLAALGGTLRGAEIANWRLAFGIFHGSTDSLAGTTLAFDVYHRRLRRSTGPFL